MCNAIKILILQVDINKFLLNQGNLGDVQAVQRIIHLFFAELTTASEKAHCLAKTPPL